MLRRIYQATWGRIVAQELSGAPDRQRFTGERWPRNQERE
jgi:hypothetical protein